MSPAPVCGPGPAGPTEPWPWGPRGIHSHLMHILRMLESSYVLDEMWHAYHVEAMRIPEVAKDPLIERFATHSLHALHAKVAAAGLARRMLAGEMNRDLLRLMEEHLRHHAREMRPALRDVQELAQKPAVAELPEVQVLRHVAGYQTQAVRTLGSEAERTLGLSLELSVGTAED